MQARHLCGQFCRRCRGLRSGQARRSVRAVLPQAPRPSSGQSGSRIPAVRVVLRKFLPGTPGERSWGSRPKGGHPARFVEPAGLTRVGPGQNGCTRDRIGAHLTSLRQGRWGAARDRLGAPSLASLASAGGAPPATGLGNKIFMGGGSTGVAAPGPVGRCPRPDW